MLHSQPKSSSKAACSLPCDQLLSRFAIPDSQSLLSAGIRRDQASQQVESIFFLRALNLAFLSFHYSFVNAVRVQTVVEVRATLDRFVVVFYQKHLSARNCFKPCRLRSVINV